MILLLNLIDILYDFTYYYFFHELNLIIFIIYGIVLIVVLFAFSYYRFNGVIFDEVYLVEHQLYQ